MREFSSAAVINKPQTFRCLTGVDPRIFRKMEKRLSSSWQRREKRKKKSGRPPGVGGLSEHLLVLLILYRCHIPQDFMAFLYRVDKSSICRTLKRIEPLARRILGVKKTIKVSEAEAQRLILDCTEQAVQRPSKKQRCWYSGKKKRHTIKSEIAVARKRKKRKIVAVSGGHTGRTHDVMIRRRGPPLPKGARALGDSAYQGHHEDGVIFTLPQKKSKNKPLTKQQREHNKQLSRQRVGVENTIAHLKNFRIMNDKFRYPRHSHHTKLAITAGILNLNNGF